MQHMNKAVIGAFITLVAGCSSPPPNPQEASLTGTRCLLFASVSDLPADRVDDIRDASDNGNLKCRIALGALYEFGRGGLSPDVRKARSLYESVAALDGAGYEQLARMAEEGSGQAPDAVEARRLYQLAFAHRESASSELALARLMEQGRGGPQDLSGALTHYLNATRQIDDPAWDGVQRLRAQGLTLTAEQTQRYNEKWYDAVGTSLTRTVYDTELLLNKQIKPGTASKPVTLEAKGKPGSLVPQFTLVESSGNNEVDQAVLKALSEYRYPAQPILKAGQESWSSEFPVKVGVN
ncbi:Sel1-like [Pseudomonas serboccidentalis]